MAPDLVIQLTPEQEQQLEPLFEQALKSQQETGKPSMILAQVFRDGMRVKFLPNQYANRIMQTINGAKVQVRTRAKGVH